MHTPEKMALHAQIEIQLDALPAGERVAVVTLLGSLCPITLGHVQAFIEARRLLLGVEGCARPVRLMSFADVLGFVSLNGDGYVSRKLKAKGEPSLSYSDRQTLVQLAIADLPWMECERWEGESMERLRARWPRLTFVHFCMNGADDVVRRQKFTWATAFNRYITMGRPGDTEKVVEGMKRAGIDPEEGIFVLGPELPDISSSDARSALARSDHEQLARMLHPRVIEWCVKKGPWKAQ